MEAQSTALTQVAPLQAALAIATEAGDITGLRDVAAMAAALQKGAKSRGLGVAAENQAAEVVIRAERGIGLVLIGMKTGGWLTKGRVTRLPDDQVTPQAVRHRRQRDEAGLKPLEELVSLSDLGVSNMQSSNFQQLAGIPEETFEALLAKAREEAERIAKVDFYRVARPRSADPGVVEGENDPQAVNPGFVSIRSGIYKLLGWEVDDEGEGRATKNGLTTLPTDQLTELKTLVEALALAFGVAMKARRAAA